MEIERVIHTEIVKTEKEVARLRNKLRAFRVARRLLNIAPAEYRRTPKRRLSAQGRANIVAAAKKRWANVHKHRGHVLQIRGRKVA